MVKLLGVALFESWCFVFAQTEAISGGAGWIGAGLLGLVLAWVFSKQIPDERKHFNDMLRAKDDQIMKLIVSRDELAEKMAANARAAVVAVSADNKASIQAMLEATDKRHAENLDGQRLERSERQHQFDVLMEEHQKSHVDAKEARHATKELDQTMTNWLEVARHMLKIKDPEQGGQGG